MWGVLSHSHPVATLIVRTVLTQIADKVLHRSRCRQPGASCHCGEALVMAVMMVVVVVVVVIVMMLMLMLMMILAVAMAMVMVAKLSPLAVTCISECACFHAH